MPNPLPNSLASRKTIDPNWRWSEKREQGARIAAAVEQGEEWPVRKICEATGYKEPSVRAWLQHPDFLARVEEMRTIRNHRIMRLGIANRLGRLNEAKDRHGRLKQVIDARAAAASADPEKAPGAESGALARELKTLGTGDSQQVIAEYKFDAPLFRELREIEKQVAIEVGDWAEKRELSGPAGGPIMTDAAMTLARVFTPAELAEFERRMLEAPKEPAAEEEPKP